MFDRVRADRLRRMAKRQNVYLRKIRSYDEHATAHGTWHVADRRSGLVFTAPSMDAVESYLTLDSGLIGKVTNTVTPDRPGPTHVQDPLPFDQEDPVQEVLAQADEVIRRRPVVFSRPKGSVAPEAVEFLRSKGFEPLTPYPGWAYPWRSQCTTCGGVSSPSYRNLRQRPWQRCRFCIRKGRLDPERATAEAASCGFTPSTPYASLTAPWSLVHDACDSLVQLSLKELRTDPSCPACEIPSSAHG